MIFKDQTLNSFIIIALSLLFVTQVNCRKSSSGFKLPKSFKRCKRRDPDLNNCVKHSLKGVLPELVKGIPSLGVMPIDPLNIMNLDIKQGSGPVSIDLTFINVNMSGIGSINLNTVNVDTDKLKIHMNGVLSEPIIIEGDYKANGRVLILPVSGIGKCRLKLDDVSTYIGATGREIIKDKKMFMEVSDLEFKFNTTRLHLEFGNLFNGDKQLGENMNRFMNENWSEILKELKPAIESALGQAFKEISNRIFLKVPFDQMTLD